MLITWLLLVLQGLAPFVHAHTLDGHVHGDFHLPALQQYAWEIEFVSTHLHHPEDMAVGVAQGVRDEQALLPETTGSSLALPLFIDPVPLAPSGVLWTHAPPTASTASTSFITPPAQAPPVVLL